MESQGSEKLIKCIIWDLDDTIWSGTLSEDNHVVVNDDIIKYIKKFDEYGIIQSIVSKNNHNIAMSKLKDISIDEYFIYPQINHISKSDNIKKIVERFNISYDSIIFIDDNDFERYSVNLFLPEIITISPNDIESICELVNNTKPSSNQNINHRSLMKLREERLTASETFTGTNEEFLMTCNMELTIRIGNNHDINRVHELATRANKLNNLTKKVDYEYISNIINNKIYNDINTTVYVCELNDRFGYHGIVGVCLITCKENKAIIELFCISCRIEGRGIGTVFIQEVLDRIIMQNKDITKVQCKYESNVKNISSLLLLKILGFNVLQIDDINHKTLELSIPYTKKNIGWIKVNER